MRVVVGLGNPGRQYETTRHNLGFRVADRVAGRLGLGKWKEQFEALVARGDAGGEPAMVMKPQTFMNNSGEAVGALLRFYKVPPDDCLVVVDDLDLPIGKIRQRTSGSDGGHRGLRSVIELAGGPGIKRLRIGIGRPPREGEGKERAVLSHVLSGSPEEEAELDKAVELAADLALKYLETGVFENWSSP
ncbi:MAG TPA: aminoacyl-tRNA hydrolase [bacterium]